jgi:hypothetical protein
MRGFARALILASPAVDAAPAADRPAVVRFIALPAQLLARQRFPRALRSRACAARRLPS